MSYSHENPRDRGVRVGDADRESVADILREQHVAGRLQSDEFQERLDRCYEAKTYAQLDELVADLPRPEPARSSARRWPRPVLGLVPILIAAIALSGGHLFWLAIPLFFFVVRPLLWRTSGRGVGGCWGRRATSAGTSI